MNAARAPLYRFAFILKALADKPQTMRNLAESLEVSRKCIQRDLDFMRDMIGAPVAKYGRGFKLTGPAYLMSGEKIEPKYATESR